MYVPVYILCVLTGYSLLVFKTMTMVRKNVPDKQYLLGFLKGTSLLKHVNYLTGRRDQNKLQIKDFVLKCTLFILTLGLEFHK